jgi:hypothetical protein
LGVKSEKDVEDEYCTVCRAAGKDDCANCDKDIKVLESKKKET